MSNRTSQVFITFLMIVIGLALTPSAVNNITIAQNGYMWTGEIVSVDPDVSNVTILTHANIWNNSAYIVLTLNSTVRTYGTEFAVADTNPSNITHIGLTATAVYVGTIDYRTQLNSAEYTMVGLMSIFWILFLVGGIVIAVIKLFKATGITKGHRRR